MRSTYANESPRSPQHHKNYQKHPQSHIYIIRIQYVRGTVQIQYSKYRCSKFLSVFVKKANGRLAMGHTPCSVMVGSEPAGVLHAGGVRQFTMTPSTGQRPVWAMLVQRSVFRSLSYVVVVCVRRCCERRATVGDLRTVRYIRTYDTV